MISAIKRALRRLGLRREAVLIRAQILWAEDDISAELQQQWDGFDATLVADRYQFIRASRYRLAAINQELSNG